MPASPFAEFFSELESLPLVDESYKERFLQELHDHVDDSLHDEAVRGADDETAAAHTLERLGSPKHLQYNFNSMMKRYTPRQTVVFILGFIGSFFSAGLVLFAGSMLAEALWQILQLRMNPDMVDPTAFDPSGYALFIGGAMVVATIMYCSLFTAVLREWLSTSIQKNAFWLLYLLIGVLPFILMTVFLMGSYMSPLLSGQLTIAGNTREVVGLIVYTGVTFCTLTVLYALSAWYVIRTQLFGKHKTSRLFSALPAPVQKIINTYLPTLKKVRLQDVGGVLVLLYLSSWFILLTESGSAAYIQFTSDWVPGFESIGSILYAMYFMPLMVLSFIQNTFISTVMQFLPVVAAVWVTGILLTVLAVAAIVYIVLSVVQSDSQHKRFSWAAPVTLTLCALIIAGFSPDMIGYSEHNKQWEVPVTSITTKMNQRVFGPFYRIFEANGSYASIPYNTVRVTEQDGTMYIHMYTGPLFTLTLDDKVRVRTKALNSKDGIGDMVVQTEAGQQGIVRAQDSARITCDGKSIEKNTDVYTGDALSVACVRIAIDGKTIVTGKDSNIMLTNIFIDASNKWAVLTLYGNGGVPDIYAVRINE